MDSSSDLDDGSYSIIPPWLFRPYRLRFQDTCTVYNYVKKVSSNKQPPFYTRNQIASFRKDSIQFMSITTQRLYRELHRYFPKECLKQIVQDTLDKYIEQESRMVQYINLLETRKYYMEYILQEVLMDDIHCLSISPCFLLHKSDGSNTDRRIDRFEK